MVNIRVSPGTFLELAREIKGMPRADIRSKTFDRNCQTMFGVGALVTSDVWSLCGAHLSKIHALPKHLLWTLPVLETCAPEDVVCWLLGCDRKTLRKWVWPVPDAIAAQQGKVVCSCSVSHFNGTTCCLLLHVIDHLLWFCGLFGPIASKRTHADPATTG